MIDEPEFLTKDEVEGLHLKRSPARLLLGKGWRRNVPKLELADAPSPAGLRALVMRHFRGVRHVTFFQDHLQPVICVILFFHPWCWWTLGIYQAWVKRKTKPLLEEHIALGAKIAGVWW